MSGHEEILSIVTPYQQHSPCRKKIKKTPETLILRKEPIQEPVNPRKRAKEDTITDVEKYSPKETPPLFWHTVDYKGNTNEKTHGSEDLPSETDGCVRNLTKEHESWDYE